MEQSRCFMGISSLFHSLVFVFRDEKKLIALLNDSSFGPVATSRLQKISAFTSSGSQFSQAVCKLGLITDSLCIESGITAQLSSWNDCDVTRLVARQHVQRKCSFLESFTLYGSSTILIN